MEAFIDAQNLLVWIFLFPCLRWNWSVISLLLFYNIYLREKTNFILEQLCYAMILNHLIFTSFYSCYLFFSNIMFWHNLLCVLVCRFVWSQCYIPKKFVCVFLQLCERNWQMSYKGKKMKILVNMKPTYNVWILTNAGIKRFSKLLFWIADIECTWPDWM